MIEAVNNSERSFSQALSASNVANTPENFMAESAEVDQEIDNSFIIDPVAISAARRAIRATGREPSRWVVTQKRPLRRVVVRRIRATRARAFYSSIAHAGAQKAVDDGDGPPPRPSHTGSL